MCHSRALQPGDVARVAPVETFGVVRDAIFAVSFLGKRPACRETDGVALIAAGALILVWQR